MALSALVLATAASASHAATPVQRTFSDWTVTCDNGLRCVALAGREDGDLVFTIVREAGPDGAVNINLSGRWPNLVDDRPLHNWESWDSMVEHGAREFYTHDLAAVQLFVDTVRNGSRLRRDEGDDEGLSLRGLSAALLFIDEAQGRLDTHGALLRRGDKPDSTVPAAPPLPVLKAAAEPRPLGEADARRLAAAVRRTQADALARAECDDESIRADRAWPLTDAEALVHLGCWSGAYQSSGLLFRAPRTQPMKAVRVFLPSVPGEPPRDTLTSANYEPWRGLLHHEAKARGLGDCGDTVNWIFDGHSFELYSFASMEVCSGVSSFLGWPTRWRSTLAEGTP